MNKKRILSALMVLALSCGSVVPVEAAKQTRSKGGISKLALLGGASAITLAMGGFGYGTYWANNYNLKKTLRPVMQGGFIASCVAMGAGIGSWVAYGFFSKLFDKVNKAADEKMKKAEKMKNDVVKSIKNFKDSAELAVQQIKHPLTSRKVIQDKIENKNLKQEFSNTIKHEKNIENNNKFFDEDGQLNDSVCLIEKN